MAAEKLSDAAENVLFKSLTPPLHPTTIGGRKLSLSPLVFTVSHKLFTWPFGDLFSGVGSNPTSDTIKSLEGVEGELLSGGEELGEVDAKSFIYRLIKVIIDIQG